MEYEFILENNEKYQENNTKLLLVKELLEENKEKIEGYYDIDIEKFIRYDHEGELKEGRIVACRKSGWGYLNEKGKEVIPFIYDYATSFSEGLAKVRKYEKAGFIDVNGNVVIPLTYMLSEYVGSFHDGLALFRRHDKYGYINKRGRVAIATIYENANSYSEGLASVCKNNKWGFINSSGRPILPFIYDDAKKFKDGICPVKKEGKWGAIDQTGKIVVPFLYDEISEYKNNQALAIKNNCVGFIDKEGKEIVPCIYFQEEFLSDYDNDIKIKNNYITYRNKVDRVRTRTLACVKEDCLLKHITNITEFCEANNTAICFDLETKEIALVKSYNIKNNVKKENKPKKRIKKKI